MCCLTLRKISLYPLRGLYIYMEYTVYLIKKKKVGLEEKIKIFYSKRKKLNERKEIQKKGETWGDMQNRSKKSKGYTSVKKFFQSIRIATKILYIRRRGKIFALRVQISSKTGGVSTEGLKSKCRRFIGGLQTSCWGYWRQWFGKRTTAACWPFLLIVDFHRTYLANGKKRCRREKECLLKPELSTLK